MALSLASVNPIKLLVLVAVINGVTARRFLILVMRVSSDRAIMGESINGTPLARLDDNRTHADRRSRPVRDRCSSVPTAVEGAGSGSGHLGMTRPRVDEQRRGSTWSARRPG